MTKIPDMNKPVIVIGTGGHAKVLIDALNLSGRKVIGLTDPVKKPGENFFGVNVLGSDDEVLRFSTNEIRLVNGLGSLPENSLRLKLTNKMEANGYQFTEVIHPSAIIANDVTLENGVQIMAGVIIQTGTKVGRSSIINTGVIVEHDCNLNDDCHLAPGVTLSGGITIGRGSHIGTGTSIIHGITIGKNCIIAAGSIIHKNIPDDVFFMQKRQERLVEKE